MATTDVKHAETQVAEGKEDVRIGVPRYFTTPGSHPFDLVGCEVPDVGELQHS